MMKDGKRLPCKMFFIFQQRRRDENGNWTIATKKHRIRGEYFEKTELIKVLKIISKHRCCNITQKCVCCQLYR